MEQRIRCLLNSNEQFHYEFEDGKTAKSTMEGIEEWPYNWPFGTITWRLDSFTDDIQSKRHQDGAITVAFRAIGLLVRDIKFKRIRDPNVEVDIPIVFTHDDPLFVDHPNVLAYAYLPTENPRTHKWSGDMVINDRHDWHIYGDPLGQFKRYPLLAVVMHELGHSLGLKHDESNTDAIMYPYVKQPVHPNAFIWHDTDIRRFQIRYGKRNISQRFLDYFRKRRLARWDFD